MNKFFFILIMCALTFFTAAAGFAQSEPEGLSETAAKFFERWLIDRDVERALTLVSKKPILGSCMTPPGKDELEGAAARSIIRAILKTTILKVERGKTLDIVIAKDPTTLPEDAADKLKHLNETLFTIYSFKPFEDVTRNGYVCKGVEKSKRFLEKISSPSVYYIYSKIKIKKAYAPFTLITVWIKEKSDWRILTLSMTSDDD